MIGCLGVGSTLAQKLPTEEKSFSKALYEYARDQRW